MTNYISRAEAEELCDGLIQQFIGNVSTIPESIDIDTFVSNFLKCTVVYENIIEEDRDKIGFTGDGKRPIRIMKNGRPEEVVYPRNTIVLDKYLLNKDENCHRRFVLGHEAGHIIANRINPDNPAFCRAKMFGVYNKRSKRQIQYRRMAGKHNCSSAAYAAIFNEKYAETV